jgi:dGTPase
MKKGNQKNISYDDFMTDFAQKNQKSKGRKYKESDDINRTPFQRDRDRIIHTTAFRRLQGKTQVVPPDDGDHFRNRLTHTIEVSQIARDIARWLRVNEDLAEAIALAHDLGHTPFGHAGEQALNAKMKTHGLSFEHNEQSLRIVELYESRYPNFRGLNLTIEVLEGMQKHNSYFERPNNVTIHSPHIEAQIVDIADEIAYLSADLEDGLRGGFFEIADLADLHIPAIVIQSLPPSERGNRSSLVRRTIKTMLDHLIQDTHKNIEQYNIQTLQDIQKNPNLIVQFEPSFYRDFLALKKFLFDHYYHSPIVQTKNQEGQHIISEIFDFLIHNPQKMPDKFIPEEKNQYKKICDYVAGMTDQFAKKFYSQNK